MNEIETDAECDPEIQKRDRLATRGTSRRKMEAGAHIAHFGSPVIRRDTIATITAQKC